MSSEKDLIDIESYRLNEMPYEPPEIKTKKTRRYTPGIPFIAAMPIPWIMEAAKLPGHALHVALAIMYVYGMKRGQEVVLTRYHFDIFSTARGPARRGLNALQQAGLIQYTNVGHKYKVTVLSAEGLPRADTG